MEKTKILKKKITEKIKSWKKPIKFFFLKFRFGYFFNKTEPNRKWWPLSLMLVGDSENPFNYPYFI